MCPIVPILLPVMCLTVSILVIEEGWRQKRRQRSSRLFVGQNLFNSLPHYGCFALVYLEEQVEFILIFQID